MTKIPPYFLVISSVVCICLVWIRVRALHFKFDLRQVLDLSLVSLIFGFIGARLMHVVYEYPEIYLRDPIRIFDFGRGGYIYYGGLLSGLLAGWIFAKRRKLGDPFKLLDLFAPVISFGYAAGRVACLVSGCCYGPVTDWPWAYLVRDEGGHLLYRHPTPLYATLLESLVLLTLLYLERRGRKFWIFHFKSPGSLFFLWLLFHSLFRFILEFWRDDFRGPAFLFSVSGWISLFLFIFAVRSLNRRRSA